MDERERLYGTPPGVEVEYRVLGIAEVHLERRALRYVPLRGWVPA